VSYVALVGDSVFDNAAYVSGGSDVRQQLSSLLPLGSQTTLLARDGAVISEAVSQVQHLPRDATHVVISAGGNDALRESGILDQPAESVAAAVEMLAAIQNAFGQAYAGLLDAVTSTGLPAAVCTIYAKILRSRAKESGYDSACSLE